jgi:hypothetical protein
LVGVAPAAAAAAAPVLLEAIAEGLRWADMDGSDLEPPAGDAIELGGGGGGLGVEGGERIVVAMVVEGAERLTPRETHDLLVLPPDTISLVPPATAKLLAG